MKGTVVFDFDDTLVDTASFKRLLADVTRPEDAVERMAQFVFPSAARVLGRLKEDGWKLALLTFGDRAWQEGKVGRSGLLPFFDHVLYTSEPKETCIPEIVAWMGPLVFVNDHGGELDALKARLPSAVMIAVRGVKPEPSGQDTPICQDLDEVYSIIARM